MKVMICVKSFPEHDNDPQFALFEVTVELVENVLRAMGQAKDLEDDEEDGVRVGGASWYLKYYRCLDYGRLWSVLEPVLANGYAQVSDDLALSSREAVPVAMVISSMRATANAAQWRGNYRLNNELATWWIGADQWRAWAHQLGIQA